MAEENEEIAAQQEEIEETPAATEETIIENTEEQIEEPTEEVAELEMQLAQIEKLASIDPTIKESDEYKRLDDAINKAKSDTPEQKEDEDLEEEVVETKATKEEKEDPLGIINKAKKGKEDIPEDEDMMKYIKDKYSIDDTEKFFNSVNKWRGDSQELTEVNGKYEDLLEGLQELPPPIKSAITAWSNAQDYQAAFVNEGGRLDFNLDFESHDGEAIIRHYFKEKVEKLESKYDDGDIDEEDLQERVSDLLDSSKRLYQLDRDRFDSQRAEMIAKQEAEQESFKKSVSRSVENLKEEFDLSKGDLQRVRQRLVNKDFSSLFFNKDGSYKDEAATALALAMYGQKVIDVLLDQAKLAGESKAKEEVVLRGNKTKKKKLGQQAPENRQANDAIQHLKPAFPNDPYS